MFVMGRALRSLLFTAALAVPACAAHAGVGVYIGAGHPVYREYVSASPGPGYSQGHFWNAGYYSYGRWIPERWVGGDRFYDHGFRGREVWRERYGWHDRGRWEHEGWRR